MSSPRHGRVYLVGAGPGDPGLITVAGLALLRAADVVVHDRLVARELLAEARPAAEIVNYGKEVGEAALQERINALLIARARRGLSVVRLKGGDPFVFGRGFEELEACRRAGIPCTVVPGVSSAIAVPAAVGIAVTRRGVARSFAVITARREAGGPPLRDQAASYAAMDTLVVLMGRECLPELAAALIAAGRDPATPAACIQEGTTARQRLVSAPLGALAAAVDAAGLRAPMVTVIGDVVADRFDPRASTSSGGGVEQRDRAQRLVGEADGVSPRR